MATTGQTPAPRHNAGLAGNYVQSSQYDVGAVLIGGWTGDAEAFEVYSDGWIFNPGKGMWTCVQNGATATNLTTGNFAAYSITGMTLGSIGDEVFTWVEYDPDRQAYVRMSQDNRTDWKAVETEFGEDEAAEADPSEATATPTVASTGQTCNPA